MSALSPAIRSDEPLNRLAEKFLNKGVPETCVEDAVKWSLTPKTYVFSFTTDLKEEATASVVHHWYEEHEQCGTAYFPCLPAVIVTEHAVALLHEEPINMDPGEDVKAKQGENIRTVMGVWPARRQFGWLASRLQYDVVERLGLMHAPSQTEFSIGNYSPLQDYFEEDCKGRMAYYISRTLKAEAIKPGPVP